MRLVTWNVNSVRQRLPRLLAMLAGTIPTSCACRRRRSRTRSSPRWSSRPRATRSATFGQKGYNGVAIRPRGRGCEEVRTGFDGDPVPEQSRVIAARVGRPARRVRLRRERQGGRRPRLRDQARVARCARGPGSARPWTRLTRSSSPATSTSRPMTATCWDRRPLAREEPGERARAGAARRPRSRLGLTDLGRAAAGDVAGPFS